MDYSIIEINDEITNDLDIEPIFLTKPAEVTNGDQVYVIQHPLGGRLAISSESIVEGEYLE